MKDLIEKLAQAEGPSREMDAEIELAMGLQHPDGVAECLAWLDQEHLAECPTHGLLPRYTASIDAALTLADSEDDPLDLLEEALASCRDERDGVAFLPLHICIAALSAKEPSQ